MPSSESVVIPRDKLGGCQRWELGRFDAPAAETRRAESAADADPPIHLPTAAEVEQIHQEAQRTGYAAGYEEGTARARMEALRLHTLAENLETALQEIDQTVADALLSLALELARQMVCKALAAKPDLVLEVVRESLQQLFHAHATLYLHPEDAALVRTHLADTLNHAGHRIFEDEQIARGGCRVEAAGSQIDATVETRWRRLLESLGRSGAWFEDRSTP
jgi:flagellar assembly protein FliH